MRVGGISLSLGQKFGDRVNQWRLELASTVEDL